MRHASFGENKRSVLDKLIAYVRLRQVKQVLGTGGSLLDLGCGYSGELIGSLGAGYRAWGMDLRVDPENKSLVQGRVDERLPFADSSFDVVTALAIIEHVADPDKMLIEIHRVLKPGGKVLITTPSVMGKGLLELLARLRLISQTEIDDHKRYYTRETLMSAMVAGGLKHPEVKHFGILWLNLFGKGEK